MIKETITKSVAYWQQLLSILIPKIPPNGLSTNLARLDFARQVGTLAMLIIISIALVHMLLNKLSITKTPLSAKGEQETNDIENCINVNISKQQYGQNTPEEEALLSDP